MGMAENVALRSYYTNKVGGEVGGVDMLVRVCGADGRAWGWTVGLLLVVGRFRFWGRGEKLSGFLGHVRVFWVFER